MARRGRLRTCTSANLRRSCPHKVCLKCAARSALSQKKQLKRSEKLTVDIVVQLLVVQCERLELALRVPNGDVGIAQSRKEGALLGVQTVELGGARGGELDEALGGDATSLHAVVEE